MSRRRCSSASLISRMVTVSVALSSLMQMSGIPAARAFTSRERRNDSAAADKNSGEAAGPGTGWAIILAADYQGPNGTIYKAVERDAITAYSALITKLGYRADRVVMLAEGPTINRQRLNPADFYQESQANSPGPAQTIQTLLDSNESDDFKKFRTLFFVPNFGKPTSFPLYGEPTAENFLLAKKVVSKLASADSTLMIVVSAHGSDSGGAAGTERGFCILPKGATPGGPKSKQLQDTELLSFTTQARGRVFVVDACFADGLVSKAARLIGTRSGLPDKYARSAENMAETGQKAGNAILMMAASAGQAEAGDSGSLFTGQLFGCLPKPNDKDAKEPLYTFTYGSWFDKAQKAVQGEAPRRVGGPRLTGAERDAVISSRQPSMYTSDRTLLEMPLVVQQGSQKDGSNSMTVNRELRADAALRRLAALTFTGHPAWKEKVEQIIKHYREFGVMTDHEGMILRELDTDAPRPDLIETTIQDMLNKVRRSIVRRAETYNDGLGDVEAVTVGKDGLTAIKIRNGVGSSSNPYNAKKRADEVAARFKILVGLQEPWPVDIHAALNPDGKWVIEAPGIEPQLVMADPEFARRHHMNVKEFAPVLADLIRVGLDYGPNVVRSVAPPAAVAKMEEGSDFLHAGNYMRAETSLKEAIQIHPDYPEAYLKLAMVYAKQPSATNKEKVKACLQIIREEVSSDLAPNDQNDIVKRLLEMIKN